MRNLKIAIIGAGISGLAAAVRLVQSGARQLTIFEARREAGGRTRSYVDPMTGDTIDNGQHLMLGCYRSTLEYLRTIDSEHLLERIPLLIRFHEAGRSTKLHLPTKSRPPQNLLAAIWSTGLLDFREKLSASWFGMAMGTFPMKNCDVMTCADLFRKFRQTGNVVERLWAPIVLATINAPVEKASAILFLNVIREAFLSNRVEDRSSPSDFLVHIAGLSELLIDPALQMLEHFGAHIRLSTPVRGIEQKDQGLAIATDDTLEFFDAVIYSGQSSEPLPPEVRSAIPTVEYSPIVNAYFWLDRKILDGPVHAFLGTTVQWAFPKPSAYSAQRLALTVSAANDLVGHTNEEIRHILWIDLCATLSAAREARLLHHQIIREKKATALFTPSVQRGRSPASTSIPNLVLAGDLVQNGLPSTIEGAVRNGFAAAELLLS